MFGRSLTLFHLFGFAVRIDASWLIVFALIVWSLASGVFPATYEDLRPVDYWLMGLAGATALFVSIVAHELSHALVARRYGIPMKGITLFLFGGVAEMHDEPPSAKAELAMAIAGPLMSVVVAVLFFAAALISSSVPFPVGVTGVLGYLAAINVILVIFNMLPAFPLDGGRVLRALLWSRTGNLRRATRIASQTGSFFGLLIIILGVATLLWGGNLIGGLWWFLIGMFLRQAATMSYRQVLVRQALEGEPVSKFMKTDPITVPRSISVRDLIEEYIYRHHHKMYPVVDDQGRLLGCVTTREVKNLPREEWERQTVGAITQQCTPANSVSPGTDAMKALGKMGASGISRLMVVEGERLVGVIGLKDLMKFLSLRMELDDEGEQARRV